MPSLRLFFILLLVSTISKAQFLDSLKIQVGTIGTYATRGYQPLWITSNQYGKISDEKYDLSSHVKINNSILFNRNRLNDGSTITEKKKSFYVDYAIDIINNNNFKRFFFQEAFFKLGFKTFEFRAGRYKEIIGEVDSDLSSGSLGISSNAMPIPQIGVSVTDYTDIPFTAGWLQFKGQFSHGWMGQNRFFKDAFLHQKTFYLRLGKKKLKLFGGVQHYAIWGGRRDDFPKLDRDWNGFLDVLFVKEADDGSVGDPNVPPNKAGDHRGVVEGGLEWENNDLKITIYHQTPFDSGQGITFRNIDKLLGTTIKLKSSTFFTKIVGEFIYTKQMNNFYPSSARESYYNNGRYATGWEYEDRIIGTPLFINRVRANKYDPNIKTYDWNANISEISGNDNIINNRIVGGHVGFIGTINSKFTTKSLFTYTKNYGKNSIPIFNTSKEQLYFLEEISYLTSSKNLALTGALAVDWGRLTRNTGFMIGVNWNVKVKN